MIWLGVVLLVLGAFIATQNTSSKISAPMITVGIVLCLMWVFSASARDLDGRYAASPLKNWFDKLRSGRGPCCSDADGTALSDVDWQTKDGHYQVRIGGKWLDVPDDAVIKEPNRAGVTMVWPMKYMDGSIQIRCFIAGSMT